MSPLHLLAPIVAAIACVATMRLLSAFARRLRLLDNPGGRKLHGSATPMAGGPAILVGWLAGMAVFRLSNSPADASMVQRDSEIVVLALTLFLIGLADDVSGKQVRPLLKAAASLVALWAWTSWTGASAWGAVAAFGLVHSFNTIDNMNGLAGGIASIGALALLGSIVVVAGSASQASMPAVMLGALIPFVVRNWRTGSVFLGDSGSLMLGGWFAAAFLLEEHPALLLLGAVPLSDLLFVAVLRIRRGCPPWQGDRRHISHRLVEKGLNPTRAVTLLLLVQAAWSGLAVCLATSSFTTYAIEWVVVGVALVLQSGLFASVKVESHVRATPRDY